MVLTSESRFICQYSEDSTTLPLKKESGFLSVNYSSNVLIQHVLIHTAFHFWATCSLQSEGPVSLLVLPTCIINSHLLVQKSCLEIEVELHKKWDV